MLVLSRKQGERINIGDGIIVTVLRSSGSRVTLGITAPAAVPVERAELSRRELTSHLLAAADKGTVLFRELGSPGAAVEHSCRALLPSAPVQVGRAPV